MHCRRKFEVLLSTMHEKDFTIIEKSNLKNVNVLVVNQCESEKVENREKYRMIYTETRGLSVSRNMAIHNADADICLIADNDERFVERIEEIIVGAYEKIKDADLIIFKMKNFPTKLGERTRRLKKLDLLRVPSFQISFKLRAIKDRIAFDCNLGAGTGNGAGEETKFLLDCYKKKLKIYYVPVEIASLLQNESTWFFGYNERFFFDRGKTTRYIFGCSFAVAYALYYLLAKYSVYKAEISFQTALRSMLRGLRTKKIGTAYQ